MRNMKKKIIFVFLTGFFLLALVLSGCGPKDLRTVKVAYACKTVLDDESPDSAIGYVEHRVVDVPGERMYFLTLQLALYDPDTRGLVSPFPDNTIIRGVKIDSEGVVNVTYSDAYAALDGMSRTLAELCTLYTLTQFPEVKGVRKRIYEVIGEVLPEVAAELDDPQVIKNAVAAGLGIAVMLYFLNLIANLAESAEFLKYITPFGYCEGADIATAGALNGQKLAIGMALCALGVAAAFLRYTRKDIR